ncbi:MAG: hypothetical protein JXO49_08430 [Deltaproteobacteria bacterium]|nr:hypothetical protein [Candidatus Anaeroferrophillus wilburensis]MBN2889353.1 hypothetical protein [Deltaproteobacteria bacterium]
MDQRAKHFNGIKTETMARLLLSQGHWQKARQVYEEVYNQDPLGHRHIIDIIKNIDREHGEQRPSKAERSLTIIKAQKDYLNTMLHHLKEEL